MNQPIKLLCLTGNLKKGGAEKRIKALSEYLNDDKILIFIGCFGKPPQSTRFNYLIDNVSHLGKRGLIPLFSLLRMVRVIYFIKPDIIFSNLGRINLLTLILGILPIKFHGKIIIGISNHPKRFSNSLYKTLLYKHSDGVIANSHGIKNYLCNEWGLDERNIHVIHNGLNSTHITSLTEEDPVFEWYKESLPIIISIGRLNPQKNHACLIKAFSIVRKSINSRLIIIGEGRHRQDLEELVRSVGVAEDTWFAGYQYNPYKFLARSTLFVLSSKWEGFPNVILEAMVCAVPVISTDIDFGPREMIDNGKTGFLVPNDDPETLASQIQYVLENRKGEAIKEIINNARKKVETEFSLEVMVKKYQEYFEDVYNNGYV